MRWIFENFSETFDRSRGTALPQTLPEGDPEAKRILIERNLRLVAHVAKKYQGNGEELEDLISIGTIGLIKAISTFNSDVLPGCPLMPPAVLITNFL